MNHAIVSPRAQQPFSLRRCAGYFSLSLAALFGSIVSAAEQPNFIVVYCDNLGYGDIEPFGSTLHRTPNLNRMAKEGRKFTHFCVTAGVCTPSRASLMTGCYAQRVGMHTNPRDGWVLRPVSPYGLHPQEVTIAEVLKRQGYATAIVGKWHLGDQPEFLPTKQGFDWFFGVPYSDDMTARVWQKDGSIWPPLPLMEDEKVIEAPCDRDGLTRRYTEQAKQWIARHRDEPFFLYFPQAMPGSTATPFASEPFKGKSNNGPWGDSIEELDWSMGELLDQLVELKIDQRTMVIWTSDNGAPILPDLRNLARGSNRPLHGRGYTTSEGAFRVPAIAWQPGTIPADSVCDELATTLDLLPTFAKLAGGSPPERRIDGHDISELLFGREDAKSPYEAFYYYDQDQLQAVRSGRWKLFLPIQPIGRHPHFGKDLPPQDLLFDLDADVACRNNVARQHPAVVARLKSFAEQARAELGDRGKSGSGQRPPGRLPGDRQPQPQLKPSGALDVIEGERGGRHWIDQETDPPRSPEQSLQAFEIEPGYEIKLYAAEPLVFDPVAIAFDQAGRMFVVEYGDYPVGPPAGEEPLSRIVYLEDENHDGVADRRHVFADGLDFAHSLMAYRGGLLVGAKTEVLYLKDTDGDHVADVREVVFDGFVPAHPQMQIGNPRWGIDNWVYLNYGPGNVAYRDKPNDRVAIPRKDFCFDPRTMQFQADSGLGQYGNTIDPWGNRFYCTNRNPIMTTFLAPSVLSRNPYHVVAKSHYDVGKAGGDTRVYPLVEMKSNYLSHAGTHTSACGVTAYTGDLSNSDLLESVFVCEPIGHLVTRSIVRPDGILLRAQRAREKADFLASRDTWFRPSSLANGPDGALYLADMYRLWVEHPKFLPEEIAARLDWRAGEDRGRIYRIVSQRHASQPFQSPQSVEQMVELLAANHGWRQFLGQRLLVERNESSAAPALRGLLRDHQQPTTRLHALWTLEGVSALQPSDVIIALGDQHPQLRVAGLTLAHRWIDRTDVFAAASRLIDDDDIRVRFQLALALSGNQSAAATELLAELGRRDGDDRWYADGWLTSSHQRAAKLLEWLVSDASFVANGSPQRTSLLRKLATVVGARGDVNELAALLSIFGAVEQPHQNDWWRWAILGGLGEGLPRYRGARGRTSLAKLISDPPPEVADSATGLQRWLVQSEIVALDSSAPVADRAAAADLLSYRPWSDVVDTLESLIASGQPVQLQQSAIAAIAQQGTAESAAIVLRRWPELGPAIRGDALELLLRRTESTRMMLEAMEKGQLQASALSIDQRVRLLKHSDTALQKQATALFGGAVSADRAAVAKHYEQALQLPASLERGRQVFTRVCASCHRIDGQGFDAGPDLSDARNRSKPTLLYDILDPNSKVEPRFLSYSVLTIDGAVFNGLISSESAEAIVLKMAEGKQKTIGRAEIDQIKLNNVSLMPEGVEKEVTLQQMADLLEYLKR